MLRKEKIKYLEQYKKAKEKYEYLNGRLNDPNTVKYDVVKSTINKNIVDKITERDEAYSNMMYLKAKFGLLIDDLLLFHKYVLLWSDNKIANEFDMNMRKYKREFNKALDNLTI